MRYDFHVHTSRYSPCADSSAEEMCEAAIRRGLHGIALTEHDAWWPRSEVRELRAAYPQLRIYRGIEYDYDLRHFLVFLPSEAIVSFRKPRTAPALSEAVQREGGAMIWAHPFRFHHRLPPWIDEMRLDGVEVGSCNTDPYMERMARDWATAHGLRWFRNSDAHHKTMIGECSTEIAARIDCVSDLLDYLHNAS